MDALISGSADVALLMDGDRCWSLSASKLGTARVPRTARDGVRLFGDARDITILEDVNEEEVLRELNLARAGVRGLGLALILSDPESSQEVAALAAKELELLVEDAAARERVERVLFAQPMPPQFSLDDAVSRSRGWAHATQFFYELRAQQEKIAKVRRAWDVLPASLFTDSAPRRLVESALVRAGHFRELVRRCDDREQVEAWAASSALAGVSVPFGEVRRVVEGWAQPFLRDSDATPKRIIGVPKRNVIWPEALEVGAVRAHRDCLLQELDAITRSNDDGGAKRLLVRALASGAAYWECWLLERHARDDEKGATVLARSALSLAEQAGDLVRHGGVLKLWTESGFPGHRRFWREAHSTHRGNAETYLKIATQLAALLERATQSGSQEVTEELERLALRTLRDVGMPYVTHYCLGRVYSLRGNWDAARQHFTAYCLVDPLRVGVVGLLADVVSRQSPDAAVALLDSARQVLNDDPSMAVIRAKTEWERWSRGGFAGPAPKQTTLDAVDAVAAKPDTHSSMVPLAYLVAAFVFDHMSGPASALPFTEQGLRQRPRDPNLKVFHGLLLLRSGARMPGRATLEEVARQGSSGLVHGLLGALDLNEGRLSGAEAHFRNATVRASNEEERGMFLNDLGVALARAGRRADARKAFEEASRLTNHAHVRTNLALLESSSAIPAVPDSPQFLRTLDENAAIEALSRAAAPVLPVPDVQLAA